MTPAQEIARFRSLIEASNTDAPPTPAVSPELLQAGIDKDFVERFLQELKEKFLPELKAKIAALTGAAKKTWNDLVAYAQSGDQLNEGRLRKLLLGEFESLADIVAFSYRSIVKIYTGMGIVLGSALGATTAGTMFAHFMGLLSLSKAFMAVAWVVFQAIVAVFFSGLYVLGMGFVFGMAYFITHLAAEQARDAHAGPTVISRTS